MTNEMGVSPDDVLFPSPRDFEDYGRCVELWNECVDYTRKWDEKLRDTLDRCDGGVLPAEEIELWERTLDPVIQRLIRAHDIQTRSFDAGCRLALGFGLGSVVEYVGDGSNRLVKIQGGGLPRSGQPPDLRMSITSVERLGSYHVTARIGMQLLHGTVEEIAAEALPRPEIVVLEPSTAGVLPLPAEVFDETLMRELKNRINPNGLLHGRRETLLAFFDETMRRLDKESAGLHSGDVVRIHPKSGKKRHVVFHNFIEDRGIWCEDPSRRPRDQDLGGLTHCTIEPDRVELAIPRVSFNPDEVHLPSSAVMLLAVRENTRAD